MVWREGKDRITDCYFCKINLKGINRNNKHHVHYLDIPSAIRLIPHGPDLSKPDGNMEYSSDSEHSGMTVLAGDDAFKPEDDQLVPLTLAELDLTRDLNLSKESTQLLGSCFKEKYLLKPGTTSYWYREYERELRESFTFQDKSSLVYCNNIGGLIKSMGFENDATE